MTEKSAEKLDGEIGKKEPFGLEQLACEAAELLRRTIKNTEKMDFKDVKQLTGALKDLAELMGEEREAEGGSDEGGFVIRIEGDPSI